MMSTQTMLRDVQTSHERLSRTQQKLSSGNEVALGMIGDMSQRVRELVVQAGSDTTSGDSRKAIAAEIGQIIEGVKHEANATFAGRFVFAGTATTTSPYALGAGDAYSGNGAALAGEIGPGVAVQVNAIELRRARQRPRCGGQQAAARAARHRRPSAG